MNQKHTPDLQSELQSDPSGTRRMNLLNQLRTLHVSCLAAGRRPSDAQTYRDVEAATTAVAAAIRIIETLPKSDAGRN
ncbi:hypothetical protein [Caenimonas koreensis]|nr:hypothetical protein [Caenimonas koreensis]